MGRIEFGSGDVNAAWICISQNGSGNDDPCPGADSAPAGDIAGHFIKYVQSINNGTTGTQLCDFSAFAPCVAVMTQ